MLKKPVIGISSSVITDQGGMFPGYKRTYVNKDYVDAVIKNGGLPVILPFNEDKEIIKELVSCIDGLILSGGHDVAPFNYGEEPEQRLGEIFPERDKFDFMLLSEAKKKGIPILGICRGFQIINTYEGGTLYQDLSYIDSVPVYKHSQGHSPELRTHSIEIAENSILHEVFGVKEMKVNSFHHQALKKVAEGYKVSAKAKDGVIEAIEAENYPFLVGVQWHPEMLVKMYEDMNKLFTVLVNKAEERMG